MSWYNPWSWGNAAFQGGALTNKDEGTQNSRPAPTRSAANIVVTDERAMMISTVFACVRLLSNTGATLPLGFYQRTADGREHLSDDHYLRNLLQYSPNNFMSALEFRQSMWVQRVLWSNAYAKIRRVAGRPVSLVPLKPEYMVVNRETDGLKYRYTTENGVKEYNQEDIFHWKGFGSDGVTGFSNLGYARETLGLSVSADQTASKSIGGNPSAVLELDTIPTDEQKEKLREMYGAGNVTTAYQSDGGLTIIPGGMKYRGISIPPDTLQLLESRNFQIGEIARFFGIPSVLIDGAAGTGAWPASYEQQMMQFKQFSVGPMLTEFESKVSDSLVMPKDKKNIYVEHKIDGLLRADSQGRSEFYRAALGNTQQDSWMTVAEVRQKENLPKLEGTDELSKAIPPTAQGQTDAN